MIRHAAALTLCALLCALPNGRAAAASAEQIERLLATTGQVAIVRTQCRPEALAGQFEEFIDWEDSPEMRALLSVMAERCDPSAIFAGLSAHLQAAVSAEDAAALLAFYDGPAGRRLAAASPPQNVGWKGWAMRR